MKLPFISNIETEHVVRKDYVFKKNNIQPGFQLRLDMHQELRDFKQLLEMALEEVNEDLANLNK